MTEFKFKYNVFCLLRDGYFASTGQSLNVSIFEKDLGCAFLNFLNNYGSGDNSIVKIIEVTQENVMFKA